ncbi:hypothetical protein B0T16DRAFT_424000 [Cercophora newfieldiana]|uniref:Uncharacterized protein n=1 Tax=Cercophora newfieldiana TaxID=92897 RepID=A0AA40CIR6_9PEZI|nr:hypothetical protein B0T16DRAFT_424000 [Cercophora newfieldiana]
MMSARPIARAASRAPRTLRSSRLPQRRRQSTTTTSSASSSKAPNPQSHFASGVAGGVVGAALLYGAYSMTPSGRAASQINKAAKEASKKYQQAASTLQQKTPSTDDAVNAVKDFCYSYVSWVPGGRQYVDSAFKDLESIREKNGEDVDKIVSETYAKFQDIAKSGLSMESASKAYDALAELGQKLAKLAGSAADQILENHPQLKEKVGGPMKQLKQMGDAYGPEAKKMVDETWDQVSDVLKGGFSAQNADKVRKLVEEKSQKLRQFGEQAWQKGLEQAKPYLDKSPKVKELVMNNQDILKKGNATALFKQVKEAAESGDAGKLEKYVKDAADKAKSMGSKASSSMMGSASGGFAGLGQLLGGSSQEASSEIRKHIELLGELVNNHSAEGKKLIEETRNDLERLLEDKAKKAQGIVDSAEKGQ